jgi:hypothetical protein
MAQLITDRVKALRQEISDIATTLRLAKSKEGRILQQGDTERLRQRLKDIQGELNSLAAWKKP